MIIEPGITLSYGEALFNLTKKRNIVIDLSEEVNCLLKLIAQYPRFIVFLERPHIENEEKHHLIDNVFQGKINEALLNLMHILVDNFRTEYLKYILEDYLRRVLIFRNIYSATIITSYELPPTDKLKLKASLEKFTNKQLKINYLIKKEIIGGLIFKFEDTYIDYSLRDGLNEIRKDLEAANLL